MKKILSIVFSLLMVISIFNLFSAMALPLSNGTSAAGIVPVSYSGNINPVTVMGQIQFKWDSPDISGHTSYIDIPISGTEDHVLGTIHYQSTDGKRLTWWLSDLSSDDPDYQLVVSWIAVKGGDNYNTYTYPSPFEYTITIGETAFTGDSFLLSPPNNGGNTPDISHVVFCLTYREVPPESSSSESSSSESSSSESSSSGFSSSESSSSESSSSQSSSSESSKSESSSSSSQSLSSLSSASVSSSTTISENPTPRTSDRSGIALYAVILVVSGTVLFVLNKSKDHN